ncbi:2-aminoadipate transaminase isoform X2 [Bacillus rossius redtenbacheri]|uniref:2-aminoadipate transaminase isoform X2 n=2 Tax=Bacillus rossius redtenbacheri TaxID=93214 RepID=UPI002FDEF2B3
MNHYIFINAVFRMSRCYKLLRSCSKTGIKNHPVHRGIRILSQICTKMADYTTEEIKDLPQNHLFDHKGVLNVYNKEVVNLSAGAPGPDLLKKCIAIFSQATAHRLKEQENAYLFQYGPMAGLWDYRAQLAEFLTARYGETVNRQDLVLTCGASHGLMLIMNTFLPSNAVIFVDEVTYMIALEVFRQFPDMTVVPVPMTEEGVDTQALERIARELRSNKQRHLSDEKLFWAMYYTMPVFHNPTGLTFSTGCCQSLVEAARRLDLLVVCDDVYNLLCYGDEVRPPRRLLAYDWGSEGFQGGHVVSNGTFSKIMGPGVRVGWLEAPPRLASVLCGSGILKSGGAVNQYVSGIFASILELGLEEQHLNFLVKTYKERMSRVCDVLDEGLPPGCSFVRPRGGYFVWVRLPEGVDSADVASWCERHRKVAAIPGRRFSVAGGFRNYLRLSISFHDTAVLEQATNRLCSGIRDYISHEIKH